MIALAGGNGPVWQPLAVTLSLHAALLLALTMNWTSRSEVVVKPRPAPRFVEARLVDARSLQPKPKPKPRPAPPPAKPRPVAAKPKPAVAKPPSPPPEPIQPKPAEPPRLTAAERAAVARAELELALAEEDVLLEQAEDELLTASHTALIAEVVEANWSRPPSARNGMEAELVIRLIPTGEVVSVEVARSSGLAAFDRSAVVAVEKAGQFPELQKLPARVFEKDFRRLRLKFKPEDLRY